MPDLRSEALEYAQSNNSRFLGELKEFVTIPSISTDPEHAGDIPAQLPVLSDPVHQCPVSLPV